MDNVTFGLNPDTQVQMELMRTHIQHLETLLHNAYQSLEMIGDTLGYNLKDTEGAALMAAVPLALAIDDGLRPLAEYYRAKFIPVMEEAVYAEYPQWLAEEMSDDE